MFYVGLDVHWRTSSIRIMDGYGVVVKQMTVVGSWDRVLGVRGGLERPWAVCHEASCGYGYLYDLTFPPNGSRGVRSSRGGKLCTRGGRAWLEGLVFESSTAALRGDLLLAEIDQYDHQIKRVEQEPDRIAGGDPCVALLRTIPGVGLGTSEAVAG